MKIIKQTKPFNLYRRDNKDKFKAYFVSIYIGANRKHIRILCYSKSDDTAIKLFDELILKFHPNSDPKIFLKQNVRLLTKHDNPNYVHFEEIIFRGALGKKLEAFREKKISEPNSESYKATIKYVINKLNDEIIREESLTKELINRLYEKLTTKENHLSPESLRNYKNVIRQLCAYLDLDERKLLKDFIIYTKTQLKKKDIEISSKNRRHLERSEIRRLFKEIIEESDEKIRSNIFILFYIGIRPGDLVNIQETKDKLVVVTSKTETTCTFKKDKFFEAYKLLTNLHFENLNQKHSSEYFMSLTQKLFGERLDQYCIRHTVISHRVLSGESLKIVSQESGHASLRMLDSNYANKIMMEGDKLEDIMVFKNVLAANYRHWLIQELLLLKWPDLILNKPSDKVFNQVIEILKSNEASKVEKIDL